MSTDTRDTFGSGLSPIPYAAILVAAVVLFLFWDGPLWSAAPDVSHVGRILFSYLLVIPLVLGALVSARRFTWIRAITGIGTLWAIKLAITATLFSVLAGGTTERLDPQALPRESPEVTERQARAPRYEPAEGSFSAGAVIGRVTVGDAVPEGSVVMVQTPSPGRSLETRPSMEIHVSGGRYTRPLYPLRSIDRLRAFNEDDDFHTLHLHAAGRAGSNLPLPPRGRRTVQVPAPGLYEMRCDNHDTEHAWLLVVDHPYVAEADSEGRFVLEDVPSGEAELSALIVTDDELRIERRRSMVVARERVTLDFALP